MNKETNSTFLLGIAVLTLSLITTAAGRIIYVDTDGNGLNNGSSWPDAYNYLQDALADANSSPKPVQIRVAKGTYTPDRGTGFTTGDREATFRLLNGVTIKGGYAGFGEDDPNTRDTTAHKTILSGDLGNNDDALSKDDNSYHVVTASGTDETAVLDGFTITSGNAFTGTYTDGTNPNDHGGAIYNINGGPTINQCKFVGNWAFHGGAVFSDSNGSSTFTNCEFTENAVTGVDNCTGGAVYITNNINTTFINCTFTRNAGNDGVRTFQPRRLDRLVQMIRHATIYNRHTRDIQDHHLGTMLPDPC